MITQQLIDYIKSQQAAGKSKDEIVQILKQTGWHDADIEEAFNAVSSGITLTQTPITPAVLPGPTALFSESWKIYNEGFWKFIGISLIPVVLLFIWALFIGGGIALSNYFSGIVLIVSFVVAIILLIFGIYIGIWSQIALIFAIKDQSEQTGIKESFKRSKSYISPYFNATLAAGLLTALGTLLLIVPGIIFWVWYSFAGLFTITDNSKYGAALKQSKALSTGRWGAVFGRLVFIVAIQIIISLLASSVGNIFGSTDVGKVLSSLVSLFVTPFSIIYLFQLFLHLKNSR